MINVIHWWASHGNSQPHALHHDLGTPPFSGQYPWTIQWESKQSTKFLPS